MSSLSKRNSQYIEDVCANLSKVGLASEAAALLKTKGQSKHRKQSRERRKWSRTQANGAQRDMLEEKDEESDSDSSGFATSSDEERPEDGADADMPSESRDNEAKSSRSHRGSHGNDFLCSSPPPSLLNPSSRHTTFTLDESKLHVVSYDAKGYLEMLETQGLGTNTDDGWRLLPLIGPTRDLVHELTDVHHAYSHARPPSDHISHIRNPLNRAHSGSQAQQKFWLALWADMEDETSGDPSPRLEILLVRCSNAGPILIGSPYDFASTNLDATALRARLLATKVKSLLPSTLQTPGGTVKYSPGSPLANIHAVIGQSALASLFATIWSCMSPAATAQLERETAALQRQQAENNSLQIPVGSTPSPVDLPSAAQVAAAAHSSASYRSRKLKLSHIPFHSLPSSLDLLPGFHTRLANEQDDLTTIGNLFRGFRKALAPKGHYVNFDQSLIEARKALAERRLWVYSVYSTTCEGLSLLAGYLTIGAETNQSIAITELFTHPDYRNRNVAESLVRAVTIYYLSKAPRPKRQLICLIPDSFDAATRVFARVGFRLGEQSRLEQSLTGHEEGLKLKRGEVPPPQYSYLSWERWHEVRFETVQQGTSWHSTTV